MGVMSKGKNNLYKENNPIEQLITTIKSLMKEKKLNETQLANACGLHQPTLHRLLSGRTTDPHLSTLLQLSRYFQISLDGLFGDLATSSSKELLVKAVPIILWQDVMKGADFIHSLTLENWPNWSAMNVDLSNNALSDEAYGLRSGPCMQPRFPLNSLLYMEPNLLAQDGNLVMIYFKEVNDVGIREIIIDGPVKELCSVGGNAERRLMFNPDVHAILGVVVQVGYDLIKHNWGKS